MDTFAGKIAIVTGAASGIGEAIVRELAQQGASVVVADRDIDAARNVAAGIMDGGGKAEAFEVDVADPAAVEAMTRHAENSFGGLHLAVNNAGIGGASAATADYPVDEWKKLLAINLDGVFYGLKYEIQAMLRSEEGGAIVNMASILGSVGFANSPAYVAAKHAVVGLTKSAAMEYATRGIRVNSVGPGFIDTPLVSEAMDEATLKHIAGLHPMQRLGTVEEVSALTCFLLSDRASFITGSHHLVDGGYVAQ